MTAVARVLTVCMAFVAIAVQAQPVAFTNPLFQTSATAVGGSSADFQSADSTTSPLPLISSAVAFDASNFAAGAGIAAAGLLSTDAEANSVAGLTSSTGSSEFTGEFAGGGFFTFLLGYTSQNFMDTTAFSASTLLFQVTSNGMTLVSQIVPIAPAFSFSSFIPAGSNTFDLLLSSEASTLTGGNAQNVASVTFQVAQVVPEPTTWLLMILGIVPLASRARALSARRSALS